MDRAADSYRRFLEGDRDAAEDVMGELFYPLIFFAERYVKDFHTAEDIALDVMSDLFTKIRFDFRVSLKTYLFTLAKSRAIDHIRHRKALPVTPLLEAEDRDSDARLEEILIKNEEALALHRALGNLKEDMRAAVHLVYFGRMSYKEAAKVLGIRPKDVDNLLYRAKRILGDLLTKEGYTP